MGNHDTFSILALHWITGLDLSSCSHELHNIHYILGHNAIFFATHCCESSLIGTTLRSYVRPFSDCLRLRLRLVFGR